LAVLLRRKRRGLMASGDECGCLDPHGGSCTDFQCIRDVGVDKTSRVLVGRTRSAVVATLTLATKKPWAIAVAYFTKVEQALYLHDMAVAPRVQRRGIGRQMVEAGKGIARSWPTQAIRLDAYDAEAGAGGFYEKCGFREVGRVTYRNTPLVYYELVL
jgi:ribosomal protein S18 acetylase RimI-like enzyme